MGTPGVAQAEIFPPLDGIKSSRTVLRKNLILKILLQYLEEDNQTIINGQRRMCLTQLITVVSVMLFKGPPSF